jgi:hypothetical protein
MTRWKTIRQLASIIEAEAQGQLIDRELAVRLARQLAANHPQIQASMALVVERMTLAGGEVHDDDDADVAGLPEIVPGSFSTDHPAAARRHFEGV